MAGITNTGAPSYLNPGAAATESAAARLDLTRDQFYKILIAQLQTQDPMEPMDQQAFLTQLTQLESLSSQQKMTSGIGSLTNAIKFGHLNDASSMLGKVVVGTTKEQKLDGEGKPMVDLEGQPVIEQVPVQGLASRVVTDGNSTQLVLLVPILDANGEVVTAPGGGVLTKELAVDLDSISEIMDPLVGQDAVPSS